MACAALRSFSVACTSATRFGAQGMGFGDDLGAGLAVRLG